MRYFFVLLNPQLQLRLYSICREYKQALAAFDRKMQRVEYDRRKAEAAEKAEERKEERKLRENERKEERRRQEQRMLAVSEGRQIFIGGLALRCDDSLLSTFFSRFGQVSDCIIVRDPETRLSRGFGFVSYVETGQAEAAVSAANGVEVRELCAPHGRLSVKIAEKSKAQVDLEARRSAGPVVSKTIDRRESSDGESDKSLGREASHGDSNAENGADGCQHRQDPLKSMPNDVVQRRKSETMLEIKTRETAIAMPPPPPPPLPAQSGVKPWPAPPETKLVAPPPPPAAGAAGTASSCGKGPSVVSSGARRVGVSSASSARGRQALPGAAKERSQNGQAKCGEKGTHADGHMLLAGAEAA